MNGSIPLTQVPDKEKTLEKPPKKRQKESEKKYKPPVSDEEGEEDDDIESGEFFNAVTKFSALKPGCYYKIVRLANYRNNRMVAVPVKGFEGTFKNFNNLVQQ